MEVLYIGSKATVLHEDFMLSNINNQTHNRSLIYLLEYELWTLSRHHI
jgi:hypothetical protein